MPTDRTIPEPILDVISAARRRWTAVRVAEGLAGGAAAGTLVAAATTAALWWSGRPTLAAAATAMGVFAAWGAILALLRRPTRLAAARRLDDQNGLHDLLSTALALTDGRPGPPADAQIRAVMLASAEAAANRIAARPLRVGRMTSRAYSAVVASSALVLTLSAVASPRAGLDLQAVPSAGGTAPLAPAAAAAEQVRRPGAPAGARSGQETEAVALAAAADRLPSEVPEGAIARLARRDGGDDAAGASASATDSARSDAQFGSVPAAPPPEAAAGELGADAGGGRQQVTMQGHGDRRGGQASPNMRTAPPPWGSADWPDRRVAAGEALRRGEVPEAYRDLVRDYFAR